MSSELISLSSASSLFCCSSSVIPAVPLPETAWYEDAMMDFSPYFWCRGKRAINDMMVVQLGLAMMFFAAVLAASGLISGTISGTSGSIRNADELSMTIQPALAADGAYSREMPPPAENRAMSMPSKLS